MKLIIDIPEEVYKIGTLGLYFDCYSMKLHDTFLSGIPLEQIRAEIDDLDRYYDNDHFSGNDDAMFKCDEVLQIIDKYREGQTKWN